MSMAVLKGHEFLTRGFFAFIFDGNTTVKYNLEQK